MKKLTRWALWVYPPAWRERYRAELEALIEDSASGGRDTLDLLKEALKMRTLESWSFAQLALALGVAGLLAAALISAKTPSKWVSQTELTMTSSVASTDELSARFIHMQDEILSRTSLLEVIQDPRLNLYPEERRSQPLEDVIESMRTKDIRIDMTRLPESGIGLKVSFLYPDKIKARQTVQALISNLADHLTLEERHGGGAMQVNFEVTDPPSIPGKPSWPNRYLILSTGLGAGVLLGAVTKLVMKARRSATA